MLEVLCALTAAELLTASLSGIVNLNALAIVVLAVAVYAVLRDLRSLWRLNQGPSRGDRAPTGQRDAAMASSPSSDAGGQHG